MTSMTSRKTRSRSAAIGFGFVLWALASTAEAAPITITNVQVTIGPSIYTAATVGWTFPYTLQPGQSLVLTQSFNGAPNDSASYNFDTSDVLGPQNVGEIAITANGVTTTFIDAGQVLNVKGLDLVTNFDNEAQNYSAPMNGPGYQLMLGYADNTHTGLCGAWANSIGLNGSPTCFPTPFFTSEGVTYFDGAGALLPGVLIPDQVNPNHCPAGSPTCFEAGVLYIVATEDVPEPATLALMLTGVGLVTARQYRRRNKLLTR
jgi:hypothetical protein